MEKRHRFYEKAFVITLVMAFVFGTLPLIGNAQEPNLFVLVASMKVKQGDDAKYLAVEKDIWKPIHQELVSQGKIVGWILYRINYTGTNDEYNYATVTIFDNPANLENLFGGLDYEKIHPGMDINKAMKETMDSRKLVKRHLIQRVAFAYPENSPGPAPHKYIEVNYMKSKPGSGYLNAARSIWQPIEQEFVNSGSRAGWTLWSSVYPRGTESDFQFAAVNYYSDFSKLNAANLAEAFKKVHPGKNQQTELGKAGNTREMVRSELWEVLDVVMREQ